MIVAVIILVTIIVALFLENRVLKDKVVKMNQANRVWTEEILKYLKDNPPT